MKKVLITLFAALCVQAQAFTLDFIAYNGTSIAASGGTLIVPVIGYGNVSFTNTNTQALPINTTIISGVTINLAPTRTLIVTFLGDYAPYNINDVSFSFNGLSGAENAAMSIVPLNGTTIQITMGNVGNGAGLREVNFDAIPEPSTTLFGALSVLGLALRRRRA